MKKKLLILLVITAFALTACGGNKDKEEPKETEAVEETTEKKEEKEKETEAKKETEATKEQPGDANMGDAININDSVVVLNSIRKGVDYDKNEVIILNITWTNNTDETASFATTIGQKVFQDGQELDIAFVMDGMDSGNYSKEVRPGTTLENIEFAFNTISTNELEVEFDEWISLDSNPVVIKTPFPAE
ncbi:DUF5067 domain-containing protein [Peptostreptococcaceae bacterium OttesenSCG-928-C18]|nr:DUF5067 domain-containing protein [Peptostreptococcaceae bacterium OttesenSCG-928-C18]